MDPSTATQMDDFLNSVNREAMRILVDSWYRFSLMASLMMILRV